MAGGGQGVSQAQVSQLGNMLQSAGQPGGSMSSPTQSSYNNFASPNQNFMTYQGQGQPNQPSSGLFGATQPVQGYDVPDVTGSNVSNNMGFDGSGSDAGVAGQPVNQPQTPLQPPTQPLQQGNKPLGLAQFQSPQGLQIQGNPTSQVVQRPQR